MGLTPEQKIDLAIAYIRKCDDILLLAELEDEVAARMAIVLERIYKKDGD